MKENKQNVKTFKFRKPAGSGKSKSVAKPTTKAPKEPKEPKEPKAAKVVKKTKVVAKKRAVSATQKKTEKIVPEKVSKKHEQAEDTEMVQTYPKQKSSTSQKKRDEEQPEKKPKAAKKPQNEVKDMEMAHDDGQDVKKRKKSKSKAPVEQK